MLSKVSKLAITELGAEPNPTATLAIMGKQRGE